MLILSPVVASLVQHCNFCYFFHLHSLSMRTANGPFKNTDITSPHQSWLTLLVPSHESQNPL